MFRKWTKKSPLTPKKFHSANRIKELVGMYVPYWLFDVNAQGSAVANCTRVSSYSRGDYDYTETKHYHVSRTVNLNYLKVPTDASAKMDDRLMDRLEPYHYGDLKDFKTPYLSGYIAEKYNYDDKQMFPRVKDRVVGYTNKYIRDSIQGYTSVTITNSNINASQNNAHYTLLPVWMFIYDHDKRDYMFAMNGQTGKIVGKPPLSFAKSVLWFFGISGISFVTLQLISMIGGIF